MAKSLDAPGSAIALGGDGFHDWPSAGLLLLHGLERTVRSHYAQGLFGEAAWRRWALIS
ncbi:MAG: hypothetical protein ABJB95_00835 [Gemmatimonadales bacterium]